MARISAANIRGAPQCDRWRRRLRRGEGAWPHRRWSSSAWEDAHGASAAARGATAQAATAGSAAAEAETAARARPCRGGAAELAAVAATRGAAAACTANADKRVVAATRSRRQEMCGCQPPALLWVGQQQTRSRSPTPSRRVCPWRDRLLSAQMPHATLGCQVRPTQLTTTCLSIAHWSSEFWIGLIVLDRILRASHRAKPPAKCPREAKRNAHRTDFPPFRVSYADDGQTKVPLFSRRLLRLLFAPDH